MLSTLMKRTRIAHKLLLISLSFLLPIAVLLYFMVAGINYDIRFTRLEEFGNEYQRPLEELLRHVPQHEFLAVRMHAGDDGVESRVLSAQSKIDQALQRLKSVDALYAEDLQFTEEGLGKRQRSAANPRDLSAAWERLKRETGSLSPTAIVSRHRQIRDTVRSMISHAGDTSNLLIYMNDDTRMLVLSQVRESMSRHGRLMLGATETLFDLDIGFQRVDGKVPTYRKN